MDNPRCLPASCGDCLFCLRNTLCISLVLHVLLFVLPIHDWAPHSGAGSIKNRLPVFLVREDIPEMPGVFSAAGSPVRESLPRHERLRRGASNLRSTPQKLEKRKSANRHEVSRVDESTVFPDGADAAAYRLAVGRSASRLIAAANLSSLSPGEIVFVLHRQPGQVHPTLLLSSQSAAMISAERLLEIMRVAVEQTPLPPAWGGRFRFSLRLQVLPNQSAPGSG